ncbi:MAG: hypothetical protein MJZ91_02325 [Bacteroidales bacterium]|nr:hypothetical protein [Bacteroidales bacterium]
MNQCDDNNYGKSPAMTLCAMAKSAAQSGLSVSALSKSVAQGGLSVSALSKSVAQGGLSDSAMSKSVVQSGLSVSAMSKCAAQSGLPVSATQHCTMQFFHQKEQLGEATRSKPEPCLSPPFCRGKAILKVPNASIQKQQHTSLKLLPNL